MDKRLAPVQFSIAADFAKAADDGTRPFSGVAYGGGLILDHPYLDRVVFDLSSTKFATPAPALYAHRDPVGVIEAAAIDGKITIAGKLFADLDGPAKNIALMADRGMPWQMSVGIIPGSIEEFKAGTKVTLNGQTFDGPITAFRNNRVRETSFVALGADDSTSAEVFTIGGDRRTTTPEVTEMDQAEHDRIVAELNGRLAAQQGAIDKLQAQFSAQRKAQTLEMFSGIGKTFKDDAERDAAVKPYLAMDDEQFAAVQEIAKTKKPAPSNPLLFQHQAKEGAATDDIADSPLVKDAKARFAA